MISMRPQTVHPKIFGQHEEKSWSAQSSMTPEVHKLSFCLRGIHSISSQPDRQEKSQTTVAAPDLPILLVHTGLSSSLIGQNAEADTVPAHLPEMKYCEYSCKQVTSIKNLHNFDGNSMDIVLTRLHVSTGWCVIFMFFFQFHRKNVEIHSCSWTFNFDKQLSTYKCSEVRIIRLP